MFKTKSLLYFLLLILVASAIIIGAKIGTNEKAVTINIIIQNEDEIIYDKEITTTEKKLINVLKNIKVNLETDKSDYGAFIVSLMGIRQEEDEDGMYYWDFYIDDVYADESFSTCEIKNNSTYKFLYEYHED